MGLVLVVGMLTVVTTALGLLIWFMVALEDGRPGSAVLAAVLATALALALLWMPVAPVVEPAVATCCSCDCSVRP